ncbi:MAG TPA: VanZ family protein [Vicinamibacterales bacterium]|nr:VanZ family protein [Vicinamibacterales bacterium]
MPAHRATRFLVAIGVSLLLVLSAPFVGQIRGEIRRAFPGHFVAIVGSVIAVAVLIAIAAAIRRIRDRKAQRYGAIALALLLATIYATLNAGDNPESNVVELFHFVQYGLIALLFYRAWQPQGDLSVVLLTLLSGLMVGSVEEWFQWFIPNRVGEMKDVFLNLAAIGTGLLFAAAVDPPDRWRTTLARSSARTVRLMATATMVAFATFLQIVHLGHRVPDTEIGTFESRWSGERLLAVQAERRTRWAASAPPVKLVRLSREDQYLTEGIQHVRERNKLWAGGNIRGAWLENRILEKYYEPVLDTPTHEGARHRWPTEQRADAECRAAGTAGDPYVSRAYPYRILTWPPALVWLGVAAACAITNLGRDVLPQRAHVRAGR